MVKKKKAYKFKMFCGQCAAINIFVFCVWKHNFHLSFYILFMFFFFLQTEKVREHSDDVVKAKQNIVY